MKIKLAALFGKLVLGFVLLTIVGTVSHELGHYIPAWYFDLDPELHYASVSHSVYPPVGTAEYDHYVKQNRLVKIGGPLQTMLTGTLGIVILFYRRKSISTFGLKTVDWLAIFLALFWAREVFNPMVSIAIELFNPNGFWFGGDEARISRSFGWHYAIVPVVTGILGLFACLYILSIIPKRILPTFILGGLVGCALGWLVWMKWLGVVVMP